MSQNLHENGSFNLQTLDVLLDSISADATRPGVARRDFYKQIAGKLKAGTSSLVSAVWVSDGKSQLRIAGQSGWADLEDARKKKLQVLVRKHLASGAAQAVEDLSAGKVYLDTCKPANGFSFLYMLVRPKEDNQLLGQVFQDLVAEVAGQIEIYENSRKAETRDESARDVSHLAQLVQNAGKSKSLSQLAYHLVNDLAKITKADRVTYISNAGKILAISGASSISHKTSVVRNLTRLGKLVLASRFPIEWQSGEISFDGRRLPRNANKLVEQTDAPTGYVLPCESDGKFSGAVIFEFFDDVAHSVEQRRLIGEVVEFSSPVIARTSQYSSIPAIRFQNLIFNRMFSSPVRSLFWLISALVVGWLSWYFLFVVQRPFEIYGEGTLEPVRKQHVFSGTDGEVKSLLIDEDSKVVTGEKLLLIESRQLEKELIEVEGEIAEVQQQLRNYALTDAEGEDVDAILAEEARRASEVERLKIRLNGLKSRLEFFEERQDKLEVLSPLEGVVITPDLRRRLIDRPINRGDLLMTIAQTDGEWQIELDIADNRVEFIENAIKEAQPDPVLVEFRLVSDSSTTWFGKLEELDYRSDASGTDGTSRVRGIVSIEEEELDRSLRLGAKVFGKIECGHRSNFFLLTYELRNRISEWFFW
jgi:multidrug efflux pump subunit AcrA (membrane-fusion protein)